MNHNNNRESSIQYRESTIDVSFEHLNFVYFEFVSDFDIMISDFKLPHNSL